MIRLIFLICTPIVLGGLIAWLIVQLQKRPPAKP
jgi:hypothetical protein